MKKLILVCMLFSMYASGQSTVKGVAIYHDYKTSVPATGSEVYLIDSTMIEDTNFKNVLSLNFINRLYRNSNLFEPEATGNKSTDRSLVKMKRKDKDENKDKYAENDKLLRRFFYITTREEYKSKIDNTLSAMGKVIYGTSSLATKTLVNGGGEFTFNCKPGIYYILIKPNNTSYGIIEGEIIKLNGIDTRQVSFDLSIQ